MKKFLTYILIYFSLLIYSCDNTKKESNASNLKDELVAPSQEELAAGFRLIENNCFSCHSPNASMENRVAPPMEAVKRHYISEGTTRDEFARDLIAFLNEPSEDKSKMPGAIRRFNLMPKMNFSEEQLNQIATYIYHTELEKPDWFDKHYQEERQKHKASASLSPVEMGQSIAMKTKGILGKNLLEAINSRGTEHAVSFCSTKAIPLTDSMAIALKAHIKRVSDKNRNPDNKANKEELDYITEVKKLLAKGEKPQPKLAHLNGKQIGYYPIITNKMCLQCHGQAGSDISPTTLAKINGIYPNDKATGYRLNELRGIWVVEMEEE